MATSSEPGLSLHQDIPDRVQRIDGVAMAAYAGATWDWFQTHLDSAAAIASGFPAPVVDGQIIGALLAAHAQDAVGPGSRVVALSFRNRGPVYRGETLRITGEVVEVSEDGARVVLRQDVHVVGADGGAERPVVTGASSTVQCMIQDF